MNIHDFEALLRGVLQKRTCALTFETFGLVVAGERVRRVSASEAGCCPLGHYLLQLDEPLLTSSMLDLEDEVALRLDIPREDVVRFTLGWDLTSEDGEGGEWGALGRRLRQEFMESAV